MTNNFVWQEVGIVLLPLIVAVITQRFFRNYLKFFKGYPINLAMILLPIELVGVHLLSLLIFSFSLLHFLIFMLVFLLMLQLYDYVRRIDSFHIRQYYPLASQLLFVATSAFWIGLILLRIYSYL